MTFWPTLTVTLLETVHPALLVYVTDVVPPDTAVTVTEEAVLVLTVATEGLLDDHTKPAPPADSPKVVVLPTQVIVVVPVKAARGLLMTVTVSEPVNPAETAEQPVVLLVKEVMV